MPSFKEMSNWRTQHFDLFNQIHDALRVMYDSFSYSEIQAFVNGCEPKLAASKYWTAAALVGINACDQNIRDEVIAKWLK